MPAYQLDIDVELSAIVSKGKGVARCLTQARILLMADEGQASAGRKDSEIVEEWFKKRLAR
jgi:hypothetical protein